MLPFGQCLLTAVSFQLMLYVQERGTCAMTTGHAERSSGCLS